MPTDVIRQPFECCCALRIVFLYMEQLTYTRRRVKHLRPLFERRTVLSVKTTVRVPTTIGWPPTIFVLLVYSTTAWEERAGKSRRSRPRLPAHAHHFLALCRRGDLGRDQAGDRHPEG